MALPRHPAAACTGFTLIELMVTVAVVACLAQLAYPSYVGQVLRARRVECRSAMLQALQQQERHHTQHNRYLAYAGSAIVNLKTFSGDQLASSACTIAAEPCAGGLDLSVCVRVTGSPRQADAEAGVLHLQSDGGRGCSGTRPNTCWP